MRWHGEGQAEATTRVDVDHDERAAEEPWAPLLCAAERSAGGRGLRCVRGVAVRGVLRAGNGATEPDAWALLPLAAGGVLRRPGLGARDGVAFCGLPGDPELPGPWGG